MDSGAKQKILARLERFIQRIEIRQAQIEKCSRRYSWTRLAIAISGFGAVFFVSGILGRPAAWVTGVFWVVVFIAVARAHNRVILSIRKHRYYAKIKSTHIARIKREWNSLPESYLHDADAESIPSHPFASDLNLVGPRSLHHLIDTSFTKEGSNRLRDWLIRIEPDPEKTRAQRQLVREMVPLSRFRDRISLLSALVTLDPTERWEGGVLLRWLKTHVDTDRIYTVLTVLGLLALITPVLLVLNLTTGLGNWWVISLTAYVFIYIMNARLYSHLFDEAEHLYSQLIRFRPVLVFLENYRFRDGGALEALMAPFQNQERPPSHFLRKATWLSVAASAQKNDVLRVLLNIIAPWELFFALMLSRYKRNLEGMLPQWLDALQRLEAAGSLATFADLNPEYAFPETDGCSGSEYSDDGIFMARGLGHPLLTDAGKIRNDFNVDQTGHIALVTGSNMSGKSTFLRALGINLSLAFAGGPVDAHSLCTVPFRLFTCINVIDSVNDGISYFYAEVKRLKRLLIELEKDHAYPVFFLVDEIFRGTNNRERFIGSRSLLLTLCTSHGAGAVSTHDLELVELESEVGTIQNYHFRELVEDGKMVFDYTLRPGPCPTTNALKIMRLEGLPVLDSNE